MVRDLTQLELLAELVPVAEDNVNRHIAAAKEWHPHDYVPWDEGRNFAALGGVDYDPEQSKLSDVAKAAMITLTESMAVELAPEITVNCVAPGQIAESADDIAEFDASFVQRAIARTPIGRLATRNEVAEVILSLCGQRFDMVTGATIPIDGGWRINRF